MTTKEEQNLVKAEILLNRYHDVAKLYRRYSQIDENIEINCYESYCRSSEKSGQVISIAEIEAIKLLDDVFEFLEADDE